MKNYELVFMFLGEDNTIDSYTLNFGPQHPAAHGVLRLLLELKVFDASARPRIIPLIIMHVG